MTPLRFSRRLHDNHPGDATYACAIERFERRRRHLAAADIALYLVAVLAVIVIVWIA